MSVHKIKVGDVFGHLVVIGEPYLKRYSSGKGRTVVPCRCRCAAGTELAVAPGNLCSGNTRSCGCLRLAFLVARSTRHSGKGTRLYTTWKNMRQRCRNRNDPDYPAYSRYGVDLCPGWDDFGVFRSWALSSGYRDDLTIERVDPAGLYEPSNCTWIPHPDQARNKNNHHRVTAFGETKLITDWERDRRCVVTRKALEYRLKHGMNPEEALTKPATRSGPLKPAPRSKP